MSIQAVVAFWQKVQEDVRLQKQMNPKAGIVPELHADSTLAELESLNRIAREEGFETTAEDFRAAEAVTRFWGRVSEDKNLQKEMIGAEGLERCRSGEVHFLDRDASGLQVHGRAARHGLEGAASGSRRTLLAAS